MTETQLAYRQLCETTYLPLASQAWWLDVVCGATNWDACLCSDKAGQIVAAMPYYLQSRWGLQLIAMPPFTTYTPIYMVFPLQQPLKRVRRYTLEKQWLEQLIAQLPLVSFYKQNFTAKLQNWLPFHWAGYQQMTRYTYQLRDLTDIAAIFAGFKNTVRSDIKKAQRLVNVTSDNKVEALFDLITQSFERKKQTNPLSKSILVELNKALQKRQHNHIFLAKDKVTNEAHAALFLIYDDQQASVLLTGIASKHTNSAALQLLYWEAIQLVHQKGIALFDFEGSMNKGIEHLMRAFGGERVPYYQIYRAKNKWLATLALWLGKF